MTYWFNAGKSAVGAVLMAIPAEAALEGMFTSIKSNTVVISSHGDIGAVVSLVLFFVGAFLTVHGLLTGIEKSLRDNKWEYTED